MYVVVNHDINDTGRFWAAAESVATGLPAGLKVVHTFPSPDGRKAVCVWEGPSVEAVRNFLDPATAGMARNDYFEAPNKEGMAMPTLTGAASARWANPRERCLVSHAQLRVKLPLHPQTIVVTSVRLTACDFLHRRRCSQGAASTGRCPACRW